MVYRIVISLAHSLNERRRRKEKLTQTSSIHQPKIADLVYSASVNELPFKISTVSTTEIPRLSLPSNNHHSKTNGQRLYSEASILNNLPPGVL